MEDTLLYSINEGKRDGYTEEFSFKNGKMRLDDHSFTAQEILIEKMKRFEGMTNPADAMVYYRLSTSGRKGYFISAYGPDANHEALSFLTEVEETQDHT